MKKFVEYSVTNTDEYSAVIDMLEFIAYVENDYQDNLYEGILDKIGLTAKKRDGGLLAIAKAAGVTLIKLLAAAVKGDKETVKAIANKEITKEEVLDFVLKLDQATAHIITAPLHVIEAVTGWEILSAIKDKTKKTKAVVVKQIKDATTFIKNKMIGLDNPAAKQIIKNADAIETLANPPTLQEASVPDDLMDNPKFVKLYNRLLKQEEMALKKQQGMDDIEARWDKIKNELQQKFGYTVPYYFGDVLA